MFQSDDDQRLSSDTDGPPCRPGVCQLLSDAGLHDVQRLAVSCRHLGSWSRLLLLWLEASSCRGCQWTLPLVHGHKDSQFVIYIYCLVEFCKLLYLGSRIHIFCISTFFKDESCIRQHFIQWGRLTSVVIKKLMITSGDSGHFLSLGWKKKHCLSTE